MVIYITYYKPLNVAFLNYLEIFNELCILGVSIHLYLFTQFLDNPQIQYNIGYSLIGLTILNIAINMGIIVVQGGKAIIQIVKILFRKFKQRKAKLF